MAIYNEYLTGAIRESAIEDAKLQNEFDRLQTMFEMTDLQLSQMERDAELKVFAESGTYDDLAFLMQEAQQEVAQQKQGIISKIIEAIKKLFSSIGNKIKEFLGMKDVDEIEVKKDTVEKCNFVKNAVNNVQNGMSQIKSGQIGSGVLTIAKALAIPATFTAAAGAGAVAVVKMKKGEADGLVKMLEGAKTKLESGWNGITSKIMSLVSPKDQSDGNKVNTTIQKFASFISKIISDIMAGITNAAGKVAKGVSGAAGGAKGLVGKLKDKMGNNTNDANTDGNTAQNDNGQANTAGAPDSVIPPALNAQGTVIKTSRNGQKFIISPSKGRMYEFKNNQWVKTNTVPKDIKKAFNNLKFNNNNTETTEEAVAFLSKELEGLYTVESTEDGQFVFTNIEELALEDARTSIFGYDISNELEIQESDAFDKELEELSKLFESL